jgi:hypothetical protein
VGPLDGEVPVAEEHLEPRCAIEEAIDGGPVHARMLDQHGLPVSLEGELEGREVVGPLGMEHDLGERELEHPLWPGQVVAEVEKAHREGRPRGSAMEVQRISTAGASR